MLLPADIMAAKLLIQLGYVSAPEVRKHLQATAADPQTRYDLVNRLTWELLIDHAQYKQIRQYVAMYEHMREEAMFLWVLEKRGQAADDTHSLIAEVERQAYRCRLGDLLVHLGKLTAEELEEIEQEALAQMRNNDAQVVNHFAVHDFQGIEIPLIPGETITPASFRLPVLFRGEQTLKLVDAELRKSQAKAPDSDPFLNATGSIPETSAPAAYAYAEEDTKRVDRSRLEDSTTDLDYKYLPPWLGSAPTWCTTAWARGAWGRCIWGRSPSAVSSWRSRS